MKVLKIIGICFAVLVVVLVASSIARGTPQTPAQSSSTIGSGSSAVQALPPSAPAAAPVAPVPSGPATSVSEGGTYHVGEDIAAGSWKTTGPPDGAVMDMCVWQRARNDSGEISAVITSGIIQGPTSVTIKAGEYLILSGECAWNRK